MRNTIIAAALLALSTGSASALCSYFDTPAECRHKEQLEAMQAQTEAAQAQAEAMREAAEQAREQAEALREQNRILQQDQIDRMIFGRPYR